MSLSNLQVIGRLQPLLPDPAGMAKLLQVSLQAACKLLEHTRQWLHTQHPEWKLV